MCAGDPRRCRTTARHTRYGRWIGTCRRRSAMSEEERKGTISVFEGPTPIAAVCGDIAAECEPVAAFLRTAANDGVTPAEIGVFVRSRAEMPRAYAAVQTAGLAWGDFTDRSAATAGKVGVGVMHLAKGLEFKAVAVIACDADVLPLKARMDAVVDESDLDEVFETERQLFYVACTRARDRLLSARRAHRQITSKI